MLHAHLAPTRRPRTPTSSTTTSWSGSAAYDLDGAATSAGHRRRPRRRPGPARRSATPDGRPTLVPFVAALVPEVDVAGGRVVVADRPGPGRAASRRRGRGGLTACGSTSSRSSRTTSTPLRPVAGRQGARRAACSTSRVHDLRAWTHDRHRTVDDTPYGGGAGMVMKPEPWGEALDAAGRRPGGRDARRADAGRGAVHPGDGPRPGRRASTWCSPAGGTRGSTSGCVDDAARPRSRCASCRWATTCSTAARWPRWRSCEAVVRLLPGFMGNAESLVEESHEDGLLEAPVYTKPASWRGLDVPPVLLSGDHGAIARWRHEQSVRRTATAPARPRSRRRCCATDVVVRRGRARRRRRAAHPAARLLGPGGAGQPRRRRSRALAESLDDVRGVAHRGRGARRPLARAAGRGRARGPARRGVARRAADGGARTSRAAAWGGALLEAVEAEAPAGGDVVRPLHRRGQQAQPADVQEGGLPARAASPQPRASCRWSKPRTDRADFLATA